MMEKQYGAIPFVRDKEGLRVVLITSASGYWIFPKGCFEEKLGKSGTAELEAWEEAGVKGKICKNNTYRTKVFIKSGERVHLTLYALEVKTVAESWKEDGRRRRKVVSLKEAEKLIDSNELRACLELFERDYMV
jgi:8-oxo-dGTP pyrophosphatase MutT (NUDIX family)